MLDYSGSQTNWIAPRSPQRVWFLRVLEMYASHQLIDESCSADQGLHQFQLRLTVPSTSVSSSVTFSHPTDEREHEILSISQCPLTSSSMTSILSVRPIYSCIVVFRAFFHHALPKIWNLEVFLYQKSLVCVTTSSIRHFARMCPLRIDTHSPRTLINSLTIALLSVRFSYPHILLIHMYSAYEFMYMFILRLYYFTASLAVIRHLQCVSSIRDVKSVNLFSVLTRSNMLFCCADFILYQKFLSRKLIIPKFSSSISLIRTTRNQQVTLLLCTVQKTVYPEILTQRSHFYHWRVLHWLILPPGSFSCLLPFLSCISQPPTCKCLVSLRRISH